MRTLFSTLLFSMLVFATAAQTALDDYVEAGLTNNIVLQQKNIALDKALLSLKIAQGMFLPTVAMQGSYTSGDGGRSISIPVGDLMNPVYATLNQLTGTNAFPQIENVNENFFPNNLYDVHVRTSMPLYNSSLVYNKKIAAQQTELQTYEVDIYRRELVKNIKTAYYQYLSAAEAVRIYENAQQLAEEAKRVNESLLKNGKGLPAYVIRSESEIENIKTRLAEAIAQRTSAQLYFNFLLNRDGAETIDHQYDPSVDVASITTSETPDLQRREEIRQVTHAAFLQETVVKMNQSFWHPKLSGFVDLGSQQQDWKFNDQSRYYLVGVTLDVPLFAGFTNRHKIKQSQADLRSAQLSQVNVQHQVNMSVVNARNQLQTALQSYQSALKQQEAARSYQKLIERGYKEGINTFIESIDARNQLTNAELQTVISQYRVLTAQAVYERETASYTFDKK